jgi:hypothetical protein
VTEATCHLPLAVVAGWAAALVASPTTTVAIVGVTATFAVTVIVDVKRVRSRVR